jgi:aryl-alcohol dehydrogenase-like predicted oxidoreductase
MRHPTLGRTGLPVSRTAFGTWQPGRASVPAGESAAIEAIRRAAGLGGTLFGPAGACAFGVSEYLLAQAIYGLDRGQPVVVTKGGLRPAVRPGLVA